MSLFNKHDLLFISHTLFSVLPSLLQAKSTDAVFTSHTGQMHSNELSAFTRHCEYLVQFEESHGSKCFKTNEEKVGK